MSDQDFFRATFLPFLRASDRPMAIACFLLVTFLPLPLLSVPRLRRRIADATSFDALFDVLRDDDDFLAGEDFLPDEDFLRGAMTIS